MSTRSRSAKNIPKEVSHVTIESIPNDILGNNIFPYLEVASLARAALVCTKWHKIITNPEYDEVIWKVYNSNMNMPLCKSILMKSLVCLHEELGNG
jgi:hypothetical protein